MELSYVPCLIMFVSCVSCVSCLRFSGIKICKDFYKRISVIGNVTFRHIVELVRNGSK